VNTSYGYDSVSHLLSVLHQAGVNTLDGASYTYDSAGNRTSKTNYLNGVTSNYGYDPLYELTQVTQGASTTETYSYDAVGNRLSSLGVPNYNYNPSNELTSSSSGSYTYDANGNTLSDAQGRSFTWDFENRLTQAVVPGTNGGTTTFRYDPFGRRIQKSGPLGTTNYLYDWINLLQELDVAGNTLARYVQGPGIDEPVAQLRSGITSYYHQDAARSVTSLSSSNPASDNSYDYDSFGTLAASSGNTANSIRFMGREYDVETGIYEFRNRYYSAAVGRFMNEDPIGFAGGTNLYSFVTNDPIIHTDPFGWMVYKCTRPTHFGGILSFVDWLSQHGGPQHWWIKTDTKEAGLGQAGGGIPGGPGGGYTSQTEIVDHTGESTQPGSTCIPEPDEDEDCVNRELTIGQQMGLFLGQNNCHQLVNDIFDTCSKTHPSRTPPIPHLTLLAPN